MSRPETRYARSGDVSIAYQVVGEGPFDLVYVPPAVSNVDLVWDEPWRAGYFERLASFSRLILFDKRGTGASDRVVGAPTGSGPLRWTALFPLLALVAPAEAPPLAAQLLAPEQHALSPDLHSAVEAIADGGESAGADLERVVELARRDRFL